MSLASATPGLWDWSFDPPTVLMLAVVALYAIGSARTVTPARARTQQRLRDACFYSAILALAIALDSPLDALSNQLFWAHMTQHVLLLMVAAPLIVAARPWSRLWRGLPLADRRWLARGLVRGPRAAPLRGAARTFGRPLASFVLFACVLLAWHVPALFDATLRSNVLHALEHALFFTTALMFWKQVIDSPPLHAVLSSPQRVYYLIAAMVVSWLLAVVLALTPSALYAPYAHEVSRPGGISALADQQIAAGVMWVPGSVTFLIVLFVYVHRWLAQASEPQRPSRLARGY